MQKQIKKDLFEPLLMPWQNERRLNPRVLIGKNIKYRLVNMDTFQDCTLHDMSRDGALISTPDRIPLHSRIHLTIAPDSEVSFSIQIIATVVRNATNQIDEGHYFKYGCHFEYVNDPN